MAQSGFPIREHFKKVYVWDEKSGIIYQDWKLSRIALALTVLNAPVSNPVVGHTQIALLSSYFDV